MEDDLSVRGYWLDSIWPRVVLSNIRNLDGPIAFWTPPSATIDTINHLQPKNE
jgi:hypothetical protein